MVSTSSTNEGSLDFADRPGFRWSTRISLIEPVEITETSGGAYDEPRHVPPSNPKRLANEVVPAQINQPTSGRLITPQPTFDRRQREDHEPRQPSVADVQPDG